MTAIAVRTRLDGLPLRTRLTALLVVLVGVGLLTAGGVAASSLNGYLLGRVDEQLVAQASSPQLGDAREGRGGRGLRGGPPGRFHVAVIAADGSVVRLLSDTGRRGSGPDLSGLVSAAAQGPTTVPDAVGNGQWRIVVRPVTVAALPRVAGVVYATDLGDVRGTTRRLVALELGVGLVVLVLVAGAGYLLVQRSLRPLIEVEEAAAAVAAGDLSRRVPARDPRTEVGSLSRSFNEMVEQVQSAFATRAASEERLRRFAADASHELRTPLTSIRGFAELYRQGAVTSDADVARVMTRIEDESVRMASLVEDLLHLARLDQQRPLDLAPVDLLQVAADAVHDAAAVAGRRTVTLDVVGDTAPVVVGDQDRLRQVLANLVSNALAYTSDDARVTVRVGATGAPGSGFASLEVADDGPGLSAADAERVFERFYRADSSRTRADGSGGSGLGLSIVSSIVAAHGGSVDLQTTPGEGASFRVRLPLAP